ncbi:WD-40 repeat protein, partial [Reticulomyxa filosa]
KQCKKRKEMVEQQTKLQKLLKDKDEQIGQLLKQNKDEWKECNTNGNSLTPNCNQLSESNLELLRSCKLRKTFSGHSKCVYSIDRSSFDGGRFLCSGSEDCTVRLWDVDTAEQLKIFKHSGYVGCVQFSPYHYNMNHHIVICSASDDRAISFWDIEADKQIQILKGHSAGVRCIQFSPFNGSQCLCSGSWDKTIRLWDIETSEVLCILKGHAMSVRCVAFSPSQVNNDGNNGNAGMTGSGYTLCSGSNDNTIRIWDIETMKELIIFKGHEDTVSSVKYGSFESRISGGANTILSGSWDKTVRLWDIRSCQQIQVFKGHTNVVYAAEYLQFTVNSSDGIQVGDANLMCSASSDNTIRFWDIRNNSQFYEIKGIDEDKGIYCLQSLSLRNKVDLTSPTLCYGSNPGLIHLWG